MDAVTSFCALCALVVSGQTLRVAVPLVERLHLPTSLVAGALGLALLQIARGCGGATTADALALSWRGLPGFLINVVFASLFLGVKVPGPREVARHSGRQFWYGFAICWGQWSVASAMQLCVLAPAFAAKPLLLTTLPVGFAGGHGTAGGLADTYRDYNFPQGADFGLLSATVGLLSALGTGVVAVNWAIRTGVATAPPQRGTGVALTLAETRTSRRRMRGFVPLEDRESAGSLTVPLDAIDSLALHLAVIGLAMGVGWLLKVGLVAFEQTVPALKTLGLFASLPLFPLCMVGGLVTQSLFERVTPSGSAPMDRGLMERLSSTALDFLIVAAISSLNLDAVTDGLAPFVVLVLAGICWNLFCLFVLAPRMLRNDCWFERGLVEMGQNMGVLATGLLLLRMVDPASETPVLRSFTYKQLIHSTFMGGGIWTAFGVLLVHKAGALPVFGVSTLVSLLSMAACLALRDGGSAGSGEASAEAPADGADGDEPLLIPSIPAPV
mmetsp:Transcript_2249/g.8173  ORF Transcript_2249/g.8173 Transcript_2249/m.8173 type:complete len:498 (-) Transcript_2249:86-1579(-)